MSGEEGAKGENAEDYIKRVISYCMLRDMTVEGTLRYLTALRVKLTDANNLEKGKPDNTHEKICRIDNFIKELE